MHPGPRGCLTCPLPRCVYDESRGALRLATAERQKRVVALLEQGLAPKAVAQRLGISRRSVFRFARGERLVARRTRQYFRYFRAYRFKCLCGHWAEGRYALELERPLAHGEAAPPVDKTREVCQYCGKTAADLDAQVAAKDEERRELKNGDAA